MTYTKLLNQLIDSSGLQLKEIAERCNSLGENISASYISVLKNTEGRTASENVSIAIAKACGAEHHNILVVQAYLDSAPRPIIELLNNIKETTLVASLHVLKNQFTDAVFQEIKKEIENMPLSQFICEANKFQSPSSILDLDIPSDSNVSIDGFNSILIIDEAMEPLFPKGSKVKYESITTIKTGNIVVYKILSTSEIKLRLCAEAEDGKWSFIPLNNNFEVEIFNSEEFIIIGKATEITTKL